MDIYEVIDLNDHSAPELNMVEISKIIERHQNIALQLSGGRDSLACLYLLKDHLHKICVYWCDTGDSFPETLDVIEDVKKIAPNFVRVDGFMKQCIATYGIPSEIVPVENTKAHLINNDLDDVMIQSRDECCFRSRSLPLHTRMVEDCTTLIIRGHRNDEVLKSRVRSGDVIGDVEYLFPIEQWSSGDVDEFLSKNGVKRQRFYEFGDTAHECMGCTGYTDTGMQNYMKIYHHKQYEDNRLKLLLIAEAVNKSITKFNKEVSI